MAVTIDWQNYDLLEIHVSLKLCLLDRWHIWQFAISLPDSQSTSNIFSFKISAKILNKYCQLYLIKNYLFAFKYKHVKYAPNLCHNKYMCLSCASSEISNVCMVSTIAAKHSEIEVDLNRIVGELII